MENTEDQAWACWHMGSLANQKGSSEPGLCQCLSYYAFVLRHLHKFWTLPSFLHPLYWLSFYHYQAISFVFKIKYYHLSFAIKEEQLISNSYSMISYINFDWMRLLPMMSPHCFVLHPKWIETFFTTVSMSLGYHTWFADSIFNLENVQT